MRCRKPSRLSSKVACEGQAPHCVWVKTGRSRPNECRPLSNLPSTRACREDDECRQTIPCLDFSIDDCPRRCFPEQTLSMCFPRPWTRALCPILVGQHQCGLSTECQFHDRSGHCRPATSGTSGSCGLPGERTTGDPLMTEEETTESDTTESPSAGTLPTTSATAARCDLDQLPTREAATGPPLSFCECASECLHRVPLLPNTSRGHTAAATLFPFAASAQRGASFADPFVELIVCGFGLLARHRRVPE